MSRENGVSRSSCGISANEIKSSRSSDNNNDNNYEMMMKMEQRRGEAKRGSTNATRRDNLMQLGDLKNY